jgi:DNA-directed RNA polymerase subunit RPC12/RpoP
MASGATKWNCRNCGRANKTALAADGATACQYCTEVVRAKAPAGKAVQVASNRQIVDRLRQRYSQARDIVSPAEPHAHLEWILGPLRNRERDEAGFEVGLAELVVLWLQDFAMELDLPTPAQPDAGAVPSEGSAAGPRQAAVHGLRAATREFAVAFLECPGAEEAA